jgi:hypothetical protein
MSAIADHLHVTQSPSVTHNNLHIIRAGANFIQYVDFTFPLDALSLVLHSQGNSNVTYEHPLICLCSTTSLHLHCNNTRQLPDIGRLVCRQINHPYTLHTQDASLKRQELCIRRITRPGRQLAQPNIRR